MPGKKKGEASKNSEPLPKKKKGFLSKYMDWLVKGVEDYRRESCPT